MPNNREWALCIWLGVLIVWGLSRRDLRASLGELTRTAVSPKILIPVLGMMAWVGGLIWLGSRWALWKPALAADTTLWLVTSGLVLFGNYQEAYARPHFFRRKAISAVRATVLLEAYVGLKSFNLPIELILQPVLASFAALSVVAARQQQSREVTRFIGVV